MNKNGSEKHLLIAKAICLAMCLVFVVSLFVTGALADTGCKVKCCCQSNPTDRHPEPGKQIKSARGCCSGSPLNPCDLESGRSFDLPQVIVGSVGSDSTHAVGAPGHLSSVFYDRLVFSSHNPHRYEVEKIHSPPLDLKNLIFLV